MLLRKPSPLWLGVSVFALSAAMIPLAGQLRRPTAKAPGTLTALTERLSRCTPELYVVPGYPDNSDHAIWVCVQPRSREQLLKRLIRDPERVKRGLWQGIVYCERRSESWLIEDRFIQDNWGEYGMRIGPFVLFGDPELLLRIREEILDYKS